jgi:hypothetical protein
LAAQSFTTLLPGKTYFVIAWSKKAFPMLWHPLPRRVMSSCEHAPPLDPEHPGIDSLAQDLTVRVPTSTYWVMALLKRAFGLSYMVWQPGISDSSSRHASSREGPGVVWQ